MSVWHLNGINVLALESSVVFKDRGGWGSALNLSLGSSGRGYAG